MAKAKDLTELLNNSCSTRKYFVSLPVKLQMHLHDYYTSICTFEQLLFTADKLNQPVHSNRFK